MATPGDIYGAFADYVADSIPTLAGVWMLDEPEGVQIDPNGYAVVEDGGFQTSWNTEDEWVTEGTLTLHNFASNADLARNNALAAERLFGNSSLSLLATITTDETFHFIEITERGHTLTVEADPNNTGARVYDYATAFDVKAQGRYVTAATPSPPVPPPDEEGGFILASESPDTLILIEDPDIFLVV